MLLPVALTTAGAAGLINLWLGVRVSRVRIAEKILIGDGGNPRLIARMRAQLNFAEYTPIVLILIALVEFGAGSQFWLWLVSVLFVLSRLLHPIGMDGSRPLRMVGIAVTMLVLLGLSLFAVYLGYAYGNPMR